MSERAWVHCQRGARRRPAATLDQRPTRVGLCSRCVEGVSPGAPYRRVPAVGCGPSSGSVVGVAGGIGGVRIVGVGESGGSSTCSTSSCVSSASMPLRRPMSRLKNPIGQMLTRGDTLDQRALP